MKETVLMIFTIIWSLLAYGQSGNISDGNNRLPENSVRKVTVTWLGPGKATVFLNEDRYMFTPLQHQILSFKGGVPYTLKIKPADNNTYTYSEFVDFNKTGQRVDLALTDNKVTITSPGKVLSQLNEDMVLIQGGRFTMGCPNVPGSPCMNLEKPNPTVVLSSFYISKFDITQRQWQAVMGNNPSHFKGCGECPVEMVSWDDAMVFIKKLNELSGRHFRLPTNAEWEFAAKAGNESQNYRYSGSNDIDAVSWYYDNKGNASTQPVGQKKPNEQGLYDMNGNVFQWCSDWYDVDYLAKLYSANQPAINPQGPDSPTVSTDLDPEGPSNGRYRVVRGGSWRLPSCYISVSLFFRFAPEFKWADTGFRLAEDVK